MDKILNKDNLNFCAVELQFLFELSSFNKSILPSTLKEYIVSPQKSKSNICFNTSHFIMLALVFWNAYADCRPALYAPKVHM